MLAADFGDAATATGAAYVSASHEAIGPKLGVLREANASGVANALANGDASDEDGVVFSALRTGQAATMTVHVSDAPAGALLYAAIDFNRDGDWFDADERIAFNAPVVAGDNVLNFTVPAPAVNGNYHAYARVRLSTASIAGPSGVAPDGEVEDYLVPIAHADSGPFGGQQPLSFNDASRIVPTDLDGDGDLDLLTNRMSWLQNINGRYAEDALLLSPTGPSLSVGALAFAPADVDGDGDMDFFASLASSEGVSWYENDGNERFTRRSLETGFASDAIAATDLDGDGDLDLVSGASGGVMHWYVNDGAQTFAKIVIQGSPTGVRSLVVDDMDGDGDLDLMAASSSAQTIKWLENDGSQQFAVRDVAAANANLRSITTADLDGDGDLDVLAAFVGTQGGIVWYQNDGSQAFAPQNLDSSAWTASSLTVADLDGDGDLDVAASGTNRTAWYENDGDEAFALRIIADAVGVHLDVAAADVDGDGRLDLVTTGTGTAPIAWYPQLAEYDYGDAPSPYRVYSQQNGARHNAVGPRLGAMRDAEADGARAPAGAEAEDDGVVFGTLTLSESTGTVTVNVQNAAAGAKLDAWIDFDGDGSWGLAGEQIASSLSVVEGDNLLSFVIPSWAVAGATQARIRVSTAGGLGPNGVGVDGEAEDHAVTIADRPPATGVFGAAQGVGTPSSSYTEFVVTSDVDGDGDTDLVSKSPGVFAWHENLGSNQFVARSVGFSGISGLSEDIAVGDLDSDGDVDFLGIAVVQSRTILLWAENDGNQNFTRREAVLASNAFTSFVALSLADLDADGDMDVLAASLNSGVGALINNGRQEFTSVFVGSVGNFNSAASSVVAADLDADGDLDVVAGGRGDGTINSSDVAWFQNNGNLSFTRRGIERSAYAPFSSSFTESVAVGDVDGDGDLDVVSAGVPSGGNVNQPATLVWHEQIAGNAFVDHVIELGRYYRWATLADFNGDGDLDVVAGGYAYNVPTTTLDLFENLGSHFLRSTLAEIQGGSLNSAAADMDGDGDLDVVAQGLTGGYRISWFENFNLVDPDHGDAPAPYPTTRVGGGAVHNGVGPRLGASRTTEANGVPSASADADAGDDGVAFSPLQVGQPLAAVTVNVQNAPVGARLDAWIDFNGDGSWDGAGEQIFGSYSVVEGDNVLAFSLPSNIIAGGTFARVRLSTGGGLRTGGAALDGEVEDYSLVIAPPAPAAGEYQIGEYLGPAYQTIQIADVDGDGDADYVAASPRLAWHENLGDGAFLTHSRTFQNAPSALNTRPVDLDGDGDVDVAVIVSNGIAWFENDGLQNFAYRAATATNNTFSGVFDLADVDGDGDLDALAARSAPSTQSLVLLLNDGQQRFAAPLLLTTINVAASAIRAADVDGDGDVDFAVTFEGSNSSGGVGWYENAGGVWNFHDVTLNSPAEARRAGRDVVPIDFDFDGDLDLVASTYSSSIQLGLEIFRNDGNQNFHRETLATLASIFDGYNSQSRGGRLQVADLDADGDYDAVLGGNRNVRLYHNHGAAGFVQSLLAEFVPSTGAAVAVGDVDGDRRLEILATHGSTGATIRFDDRPFGDYDRNGTVDQADRDLYEATLGQPAVPPGAGADGDRSGVVDAADLAIWEANQGAGMAPPVRAADLDQNEAIDGADFLLWQRSFGSTSNVPGGNLADVDFSKSVDGGDLAVWARQFGGGVAPPVSAIVVATSSAMATSAALAVASPALDSSAAASSFALPANVILAVPTEKPVSKKSDALHLLKRNSTAPRDAAFAALASPVTFSLRRQRLPASKPAPASDATPAQIDDALVDEFLTRILDR